MQLEHEHKINHKNYTLLQALVNANLGPFWALPTAFLSGTAAAGSLALIKSVGN